MKRVKTIILAIGLTAMSSVACGSTKLSQSVARADLCVTEGKIDELAAPQRFSVDSPNMRAYVNGTPVQSIEARFTYLGATSHDVALGSGTTRRQFGLKLRAQDACNLVYAMWRIEPESKLVISIKENPGQHSSAECRNRGYRNIKPQRSASIPELRPGETHTLRAEMTPIAMTVYIDDMLAWQGPLSSDVKGWDERVGIRSDNVRVHFELNTGPLDEQSVPKQDCKFELPELE